MELYDFQKDAVRELKSGSVLYGQVGTGKTATALAYYVENEEFRPLYVITTAKKRDSGDWQEEAAKFGVTKIVVDSWNNVDKYTEVEEAFFVFDEQRVVGTGAWVKAFHKITRNGNHWILLSATPGDNWSDYAPVFIANGFFKNITEFRVKHVKMKPYMPYPVVDSYINEEALEEMRNEVLVEMRYEVESRRVLNWWPVGHDKELFHRVWKKRWNPYEEQPIRDAGELFWLMRKVVNSDPSRLEEVRALHHIHPRLIIFYNWNYELDILRTLYKETSLFEWNGQRKNALDSFEELDRWVYLVQYVAGAEAWNCVSTDAMVLYSLTYSYKNFEQAQGRIDRMNSPFERLYYYVFLSDSVIDKTIKKKLEHKENFNEKSALKDMERDEPDSLELKYAALEAVEDEDFVESCDI